MKDQDRHGNPSPGDHPSALSAHDQAMIDDVKQALGEDSGPSLPAAAQPLPSRIGSYRIDSLLGEGGMGRVYQAEQANPRRAVALKVVRGGRFVDEHYLRLFQREAQTLARLRHSSIAAIYEAGHTPDGQHFFAMELVRGLPLNEYVEQRSLPLRDRLVLVQRICEAINYAHQRGVIHRDLKPSNILVDGDGNPKVLDFGLAKITDIDIAMATVVTEVGIIQGTLPYMSPEQARGNPDEIDLRSDVYSLGAILYQLATERLPHDVRRSALHEAVRAICEEEPARPSQCNRKLRGDLDTIILKSIAKEPSRRYANAAALADEIECVLTHQPIQARPPSTIYQLRKLIRRHKAASAFVLTLFLIVLGFGAWMSVLYRQADSNLTRANRAIGFLAGLFRLSDPDLGALKTHMARDVLVRGSEHIAVELRDEPATLATLMDAMATSFRNLGDSDQAMQFSQDALRIRRALYGDEHLLVAESEFTLGRAWTLKGDYAEALPLLASALATRRRLDADSALIAENLQVFAAALRGSGALREAAPLLDEALEIQRHLYDGERDETLKEMHGFAINKTLTGIVQLHLKLGDHALAEQLARKLLAGSESMLARSESINSKTDATILKSLQYVAFARETLAEVLRARGAYAEALSQWRQALPVQRASMGHDHPYYASSLSWIGVVLRDLRRYAEAESNLRQGLAIYRARFEPDHPYIASALINIGWVFFDRGNLNGAESYFEGALAIFKKTKMGDRQDRAAEAWLGLGLVALSEGKHIVAEAHLEVAVLIVRKWLSDGSWRKAVAESAWGEALVSLARFEQAEPLLTGSYQTMKDARGAHDRYVLGALQRVVTLYKAWGKPGKEAAYREMMQESAD